MGLHEPLARLPPSFEVPTARKEEPGDADKAFAQTLMKRVVEPGKIAGWVAPPALVRGLADGAAAAQHS